MPKDGGRAGSTAPRVSPGRAAPGDSPVAPLQPEVDRRHLLGVRLVVQDGGAAVKELEKTKGSKHGYQVRIAEKGSV